MGSAHPHSAQNRRPELFSVLQLAQRILEPSQGTAIRGPKSATKSWTGINPELVQEAKRLRHRTKPVTIIARIAAELAALHLNERSLRRPQAIRSVIRIIATALLTLDACSLVFLLQVQTKFFLAVNGFPSWSI
jgi:hypothetical protein